MTQTSEYRKITVILLEVEVIRESPALRLHLENIGIMMWHTHISCWVWNWGTGKICICFSLLQCFLTLDFNSQKLSSQDWNFGSWGPHIFKLLRCHNLFPKRWSVFKLPIPLDSTQNRALQFLFGKLHFKFFCSSLEHCTLVHSLKRHWCLLETSVCSVLMHTGRKPVLNQCMYSTWIKVFFLQMPARCMGFCRYWHFSVVVSAHSNTCLNLDYNWAMNFGHELLQL